MIAITGATSGIGKATAELFAKEGFDLLLIGRNAEKLSQLKIDLTDADVGKVKIDTIQVDLLNTSDVLNIFETHAELFKNVVCFINNAGLAKGMSPTHDLSVEHIETMIQTNVTSLILLCKKIVPFFMEKKAGHIINIGSVAGHHVYPNGNVYCATKHAVKAMTQGLRMDLHGSGIRVSEISPGMVNTNFSKTRLGDQQQADQVYSGMRPLQAEDIAQSIYWVFKQPSHINIQDLMIYPTDQASPTLVHRG